MQGVGGGAAVGGYRGGHKKKWGVRGKGTGSSAVLCSV